MTLKGDAEMANGIFGTRQQVKDYLLNIAVELDWRNHPDLFNIFVNSVWENLVKGGLTDEEILMDYGK